jgi:hypothetical protein
MAVRYIPEIVTDLPASFVFQPNGALREKVSRAVAMKVVRVIAGAERCHVVVDIKRPYYFPVLAELEGKNE